MKACDMVSVSPVEGTLPATGKALLPSPDALQPLALRSMFWRPKYSAESPWLEHLPFAFWLVEAHRPRLIVELGAGSPVVYFSFCQAVERLELETHCVRICGQAASGSGKAAGDEEARAYNASHYSAFSRVEAREIAAARNQFEDGSIDVLHIADGGGALSGKELSDWMSKLSSRGVLLFHGGGEQQVPASARRTAAGLARMHPMFEFGHGSGLTLVAVGTEQPELVKLLCMASGSSHARRAVHDAFSHLGRACADARAITAERSASRRLKESIEGYELRLAAMRAELSDADLGLSSRTMELEAARQKLSGQFEERAAERGHLAERITVLQEARADLKQQLETLQQRADAASATLLARVEQVGRLEQAVATREVRISQLETAMGQRDADIAALQSRAASLERTVREKDAQSAALLKDKEDLSRKASQLAQTVKRLELLLQEKEAEGEATRKERDSLEGQLHELQADARHAGARLGIAHEELADLTRFVIEAEQRTDEVAQERELVERKVHASEVRSKALYGRLVALQRLLERAPGGAGADAPARTTESSDTLEEQCRVVLRSGLFDAEWYLHRYPDIADAGADPLTHFVLHGATEFRDPGPYFSTSAYLAANGGRLPEAANPLLHYLSSEAEPTWANARLEVPHAS